MIKRVVRCALWTAIAVAGLGCEPGEGEPSRTPADIGGTPAGAPAGTQAQVARNPGRPRHVLLVTLDTVRADHLGTYGHSADTSPHFDAVAAEGTRFDMAIGVSAVTPVAHSSIMTGLNPYQHGVRVLYAGSGYKLPATIPTLATTLSAAGWRTGAVISAFPASAYFGLDLGFDHFDGGSSSRAEMEQGPEGGFSWDLRTNQRGSNVTTDRAIDWVSKSDEPFFLWVHYWDPHDGVLLPPDEYVDRFVSPSQTKKEKMRATYDAEIAYVDAQFGRLVTALQERGLWDDTVVIIVSDHGQGLGDHDWWAHRILYQEQIRVPLIVRLPGGARGSVVDSVVRQIDVMPTALDAVGLPVPEAVEGASLIGLMEGRPEDPRIAYADQLNLYDLDAKMLRRRPLDDLLYVTTDGAWKLIHRPSRPELSELYHLAEDPRELVNLYRPDHAEAVRLKAELDARDPYRDEPFERGVDREALEQLKSLGYVGDE